MNHPTIKNDTCIKCNICLENCPYKGIELQDEKYIINMETCIKCGACTQMCPMMCISQE